MVSKRREGVYSHRLSLTTEVTAQIIFGLSVAKIKKARSDERALFFKFWKYVIVVATMRL
jgi:hypothetical protein